jgi:hypothetical protein
MAIPKLPTLLASAAAFILFGCLLLWGAALPLSDESHFERLSRGLLLGSAGLAALLLGFSGLFDALSRLGYQPKGPLRSVFTPGLPKPLRTVAYWCVAMTFLFFVLALFAHA